MTALEDYKKTLSSPEDQQLVDTMDKIISQALPKAEVRLSYGIVGYYQPKQICFFGINKNHIGFYLTNRPIDQFRDEIKPYLHGKTTMQFSKDIQLLPKDLIQRIAQWNLAHS